MKRQAPASITAPSLRPLLIYIEGKADDLLSFKKRMLNSKSLGASESHQYLLSIRGLLGKRVLSPSLTTKVNPGGNEADWEG